MEKEITKQNTTSKKKEQTVRTPLSVYRNLKLYKEVNVCLPIYQYIISCIFRGEHGGDKFDLYNNYFKRGILASSVSLRKLAEVHGITKKTVEKRIKILIEYGFMKIEKIDTVFKKKGKIIGGKQNIYILGVCSGEKQYLLYAGTTTLVDWTNNLCKLTDNSISDVVGYSLPQRVGY
ncbi:hypothetical protein KAW18_03670 [candidate division WOR-3 bacterium]|nr:hypothetical protein [candidate division WOR-3 bacterium]